MVILRRFAAKAAVLCVVFCRELSPWWALQMRRPDFFGESGWEIQSTWEFTGVNRGDLLCIRGFTMKNTNFTKGKWE